MGLKIGSHLAVWCGTFWHHGLYVGNCRVIHYSGYVSTGGAGVVEYTSLPDFCDGGRISVIEYEYPEHPGQKAVDRAKTRLGEEEYCVYRNNCEHFVTWCITGIQKSQQVENVEDALVGATNAYGLYLTFQIDRGRPVIRDVIRDFTVRRLMRPDASSGVPYFAGQAATRAFVTAASNPTIQSAVVKGAAASVTGVVATTVGAPVLLAAAATYAVVEAGSWLWGKIFD